MIRKYIPLKKLSIFDDLHTMNPDGTFSVDEERDGSSYGEHVKGIEYIKGVLKEGSKVRPILALENEYGEFIRLDGFKRCLAHQQLGYENIEALVVSQEEYDRAEFIDYEGNEIRAWKGGQPHELYELFEGGEMEKFDYDKIPFLYKSNKQDGLRIELAECIHVHWGDCGKYRLGLGHEDFLELANAISSYGQDK